MKHIFIGYDGSDHAKRALERVVGLSQSGAAVTVMAVVHGAPTGHGPLVEDPAEESERRRELQEASSFLAGHGIQAQLVEGHGDPAEAIVEAAKSAGADLIVVGTRGLNVAERLVLGSVSTKVVHHAPCDVLVVR